MTNLSIAQTQDSINHQQEKHLVELLLTDESVIDSLVEKMIRNSYTLKSTEAELLQKQEALIQEKRSWLSALTIGVNLYSQSTAYDEETNSSVTTAGVLPNLGVALSLSPQKLSNLRSNVRIAELNITRSENAYKEQKRSMRIFITSKYLEYLEALNVLEMRYNNHESQRQQVAQTQQKFERGEASLGDVIMAQNGISSTEESLMKAKMFVRKLKTEIAIYTSDTEKSEAAQHP